MAVFFIFGPNHFSSINLPMKRIFLVAIVLLILALSFVAWRVLGPATAFSGETYDLYIRSGMNYAEVVGLLEKDTVLKNPAGFNYIAQRMDYPANIKAGKYEIAKNMNL